MDVVAFISDNCKNLGIGLLVFAASLMAQAVVTFNQNQPVTTKNQTRLITNFRNCAYYLFGAGCLAILVGIFTYIRLKLIGVNWIFVGYTLFIVGGNFTVWSNKLKATDYVSFGRRKINTAWALLGVAIFLLVIYMILAYLTALKIIS